MLERVKAKIGQTGGIRVTVDPEDSAFIVKFIGSYFQIPSYQPPAATLSERLSPRTGSRVAPRQFLLF